MHCYRTESVASSLNYPCSYTTILLEGIQKLIREKHNSVNNWHNILYFIKNALDVNAVSILLHDQYNNNIFMKETVGMKVEINFRVSIDDFRESAIGLSLKKKKVVWLYNVQQFPRWFPLFGEYEKKFSSVLSIPLLDQDSDIGVLVLHSKAKRAWKPGDIILLRALATRICQEVQDVSLYEELEDIRKKHKKLSLETLSHSLREGKEIDKIYLKEEEEVKLIKKKEDKNIYLTGTPCVGGTAFGPVLFIDDSQTILRRINKKIIPLNEREKEKENLNISRELTHNQIVKFKKNFLEKGSSNEIGIFDAHLMILKDPIFIEKMENYIYKGFDASYSIRCATEDFCDQFRSFDDSYFRDRLYDILDIGLQLITNIKGNKDYKNIDSDKGFIVVLRDLSPSQVIKLRKKNVQAIVTNDSNGSTGHGMIIARSLNIPLVTGVTGIFDKVEIGDYALVDGFTGSIRIQSKVDKKSIWNIQEKRDSRPWLRLVSDLRYLKAQTRDGRFIDLSGTVNFSNEAQSLHHYGGEKVGLYRTEFSFLSQTDPLHEDEHLKIYREMLDCVPKREMVIRSFDTGGDKPIPFFALPKENNPSLGFRGIRVSLAHEEHFSTQIRAILRLGCYGKLSLALPMVSTIHELKKVLLLLDQEKIRLRKLRIAHDPHMPVGIAVEVPSSALLLDHFINYVDFVSLGINDLTQYTLGVDRDNNHVSNIYNPLNLSILRLIKLSSSVCALNNRPLLICGDICSDPIGIIIMIGLGIKSFSLPPSHIPFIKSLVRSVCFSELLCLVNDLMAYSVDVDARSYVNEWLLKKGLFQYSCLSSFMRYSESKL